MSHMSSGRLAHGVCKKCGFDLPHMTSHGQCYVCGGEVEWEVAPVIEPPSFFIEENAGIGVYCSNCGYDLVGMHYQERCPECGGPAYQSDTIARVVAVGQLQRFRRAVRVTGFGYVMLSVTGVLAATSAYLLPFVLPNQVAITVAVALAALILGIGGLVATTTGWFRVAARIKNRRILLRTMAGIRAVAAAVLVVFVVFVLGVGIGSPSQVILAEGAFWISVSTATLYAISGVTLLILGGTILSEFGSAAGRLSMQRLSKLVPTVAVLIGVLGALVLAGPFIGSLIYGVFLLRAASMIPKSDSN